MVFKDRRHAGRILAGFLAKYDRSPDVIVLGLPRGGVPVAYEISNTLSLPLDVFVVRKLGVPGHEELAMGAVASGGLRYINRSVIEALDIDSQTIDAVSAREQAEIERRERVYRGGRLPLDVQGKTALLVDDGLATGSTMRAAIDALRQRDAARIVVVIPAAAAEACREISRVADETICAATPRFFSAVSEWYQEFSQITDEEVRQLLAKASSRALAPP